MIFKVIAIPDFSILEPPPLLRKPRVREHPRPFRPLDCEFGAGQKRPVSELNITDTPGQITQVNPTVHETPFPYTTHPPETTPETSHHVEGHYCNDLIDLIRYDQSGVYFSGIRSSGSVTTLPIKRGPSDRTHADGSIFYGVTHAKDHVVRSGLLMQPKSGANGFITARFETLMMPARGFFIAHVGFEQDADNDSQVQVELWTTHQNQNSNTIRRREARLRLQGSDQTLHRFVVDLSYLDGNFVTLELVTVMVGDVHTDQVIWAEPGLHGRVTLPLLDEAEKSRWHQLGPTTMPIGVGNRNPISVRRGNFKGIDDTTSEAMQITCRGSFVEGRLPWTEIPYNGMFEAEVGLADGHRGRRFRVDIVVQTVDASYKNTRHRLLNFETETDGQRNGFTRITADLSHLSCRDAQIWIRVAQADTHADPAAVLIRNPRIAQKDPMVAPKTEVWRFQPSKVEVTQHSEWGGDEIAVGVIYWQTVIGRPGSTRVVTRTNLTQIGGNGLRTGDEPLVPSEANLDITHLITPWDLTEILNIIARIQTFVDTNRGTMTPAQLNTRASQMLAPARRIFAPIARYGIPICGYETFSIELDNNGDQNIREILFRIGNVIEGLLKPREEIDLNRLVVNFGVQVVQAIALGRPLPNANTLIGPLFGGINQAAIQQQATDIVTEVVSRHVLNLFKAAVIPGSVVGIVTANPLYAFVTLLATVLIGWAEHHDIVGFNGARYAGLNRASFFHNLIQGGNRGLTPLIHSRGPNDAVGINNRLPDNLIAQAGDHGRHIVRLLHHSNYQYFSDIVG